MNFDFGSPTLQATSAADRRITFVRQVYLWLMGGFAVAGVGAISAPFIAGPLIGLTGRFFPWALFIAQFGALMWANSVSRKSPINRVAYGVFTFISGIVIGIVSLVTIQSAGFGPVVAAFGMTAADFLLLTVIAFVTKKDFSFLRSFVIIGVGIMFFGSLIAAIFQMETLSLVIACVAVIACSAKILYDTSNMLRTDDTSDPAAFALSLFVSLYNILLSLMRLLGGRRD